MIRRGDSRRAAHGRRAGLTDLKVSSGGTRVHLVHNGRRPSSRLAGLAEWLEPARPGHATVLVGTPLGDGGVDALCALLTPVLDESRATGVRVLRLVMSAGADEGGGRPSAARRICERWGLDVFGTAGAAVVVPDGTLFSPDLPDAPGGWWHFSHGLVPQRVGTRLPIPGWELALERLDRDIAPGYEVEPVPAGLTIRSVEARAVGVDALRYAVPPDPRRPLVLVGAPGSPRVSPDALASVIAALPGPVRESMRLLSQDGGDVLATGQAVADLLGTEVHVVNGMPLVVEGESADGVAAAPWLVGADGVPSWRPYVETAACLPATTGSRPAPRTVEYRAPMAGLTEGDEPGVWLLDRRWQVTATPAGLWVGRRGGRPSVETLFRSADPDVVTVDLGITGRALDDSFWPVLDRLFGALDPEVRGRAMVQVHGVLGATGGDTLRRLAVRHEFSVKPSRERHLAETTAASYPVHSGMDGSQEPESDGDEASDEWRFAPTATRDAESLDGGPRGTAASPEGGAPRPERPAVLQPSGTGTASAAESDAGTPPATSSAVATPARKTSTTASVPAPAPAPATTARPQGRSAAGFPGTTPAPKPKRRMDAALAGGSDPVFGAAEDRSWPIAPAGHGTWIGGTHPVDGPTLPENAARADQPGTPSSGSSAAGEPVPPMPPESRAPSGVGEEPRPGAGPAPAPPPVTDPSGDRTSEAAPRLVPPTMVPAVGGPARWLETAPAAAESTPPPTAAQPGPHRAGPGSSALFGPSDTIGVGFETTDSALATGSSAFVTGTPTLGLPPGDVFLPNQQIPAPSQGAKSSPGPDAVPAGMPPTRSAYRSTPGDRESLRSYLGDVWDRHITTVSRALIRMPGLRSGEDAAASSADLAAVHAYLTAVDAEGLRTATAAGDTQSLTFLRCLASGLRRLPSYRGAALHTGGRIGIQPVHGAAGTELGETVPVRARSVGHTDPLPSTDYCLIWSVTGRRTGALTDSGPGGGSDAVVFDPGTRFRILEVSLQGSATVALLRELPEHAVPDDSGTLSDADLTVLERLRALRAAATAPEAAP